MVAAAIFDVLQLTRAVISLVPPSVYVPTALNCWVRPRAAEPLAGVTAMDCSCATFTVSEAVPEMWLAVAVMVAVPGASPVAPPVAAFTEATFASDEVQTTPLVSG